MIQLSLQELVTLLSSAVWPLLRISGMLIAAPIFGSRSISGRLRVVLGLGLTVMVAPLLRTQNLPLIDVSGATLIIALFEVMLGLMIGFTLHLAFGVLVFAGSQIALSMGLGFASMADPQNGASVPVISQMLMILGTLVFLSVGGHLVLIGLLVDSFELLPVGQFRFDLAFFRRLAEWGSRLFAVGVLIAMPVVAMNLFTYLALGLMTRAAPQMNIFSIGFALTILTGFVAMYLNMPSILAKFQVVLFEVFELTRQASGG